MPHYAILAALVTATLFIAAIVCLRLLSARLDARIRSLQLARLSARIPAPAVGSAVFAAYREPDAWLSHAQSFEDGFETCPLDAPYRMETDAAMINPATGLLMVGGVDLAGNFYGFNSDIGFDAATLFADTHSWDDGLTTSETACSSPISSMFD